MSDKITNSCFSAALLTWYADYGRKDLPWQQDKSAYRVWISEVMLQQTQVKTVIPYYQRFMQQFPDVYTLANAPQDTVLALWSGLGYYSRARNLHNAAKQVCDNHAGELPKNIEGLISLPGIGRSTACAILSISHNANTAILDGNVKRVLSRVYKVEGWPGKSAVEKKLWGLAEKAMCKTNCADYTQAIMDLGATLCTRSQPQCEQCPLQTQCMAYKDKQVALFPEKKPRKSLPIKKTTLLVIANQNHEILVQKRAEKGIWGGLWSLPETVSNDLKGHCQQAFNLVVISSDKLLEFRHTFSHYHLDIKAHMLIIQNQALSNSDKQRWLAQTQLSSIGLPQPITKTLLHGYHRLASTA